MPTLKRWLPPLILVAVGVAVWSTGLDGVFVFDDHVAITENPSLREVSWRILRTPPQSPLTNRPLPALTLLWDFQRHGLDPRGYHQLNIALHVLSALVLWGLLRRVFASPRVGLAGAADALAFAASLLWLVHPLHADAVTYLTQRTELLMGLFYLLTVYCAVRSWDSPRRRLWWGAGITCCALGMASKEVMVSAPLLVPLFDRAFHHASWRESFRLRWPFYAGLAGTWLLLGALVAVGDVSESVGGRLPIVWQYLLAQCEMLLHYLRLSFWPDALSIDYGDLTQRGWRDALPGALVVLPLLALTLWLCWHSPRWGVLGAWFFLILAPTSSFLPIYGEVAAERRMYLPLAAPLTAAVLGAYLLGRRRAVPLRRGVALAGVVLVAAALAHQSVQRNRLFASEAAVWRDAVAKRPDNPRAQVNFGRILLREGNAGLARLYFEEALRLQPDYAPAHRGLADLLRGSDPEQAIRHYRDAIAEAPYYYPAQLGLADALAATGRTHEATEQYREAIRQRAPSALPEAELGLAEMLLRAGDPAAAVPHFRAARAALSHEARVQAGLGRALSRSGRAEEAEAPLREALALDPELAEAHADLAALLAAQGDAAAAARHYRAALRRRPDDPDARLGLAVLRARQGDAAAIGELRGLLAHDSDHAQAHLVLADIDLQQRDYRNAERHAREALRLDPDSAEAARLLGRINRRE